jgi:3-oxoacyl-[acyl-carrier protein] reductase
VGAGAEGQITGPFLVDRAAGGRTCARGYGRIVNIASVAGKEGNPNALGLQRLEGRGHRAHQVARQGAARRPVVVNCVTPAAVQTAIFDQMTQQHIDFMLSKIPLGRFGTSTRSPRLCVAVHRGCSFSTGAVFDCRAARDVLGVARVAPFRRNPSFSNRSPALCTNSPLHLHPLREGFSSETPSLAA